MKERRGEGISAVISVDWPLLLMICSIFGDGKHELNLLSVRECIVALNQNDGAS